MKKSNKTLLILLFVLLLGAVAALVYMNLVQRSEMTELVEQMTIEKEELQEEYEDLAIQFDGYQNLDIRNDSLQDLLSREQQRVQDLLEELRVTKATNARRIAELKKELATVRAVMRDYVRQIDSLNATNQRLEAENLRVSTENAHLNNENSRLNTENAQLSETVSRAAMLEVTACNVLMLNKSDRKTRIVSQARKLQIDYTIDKNITCPPGMKNVYLRINTPDGELLATEPAHVFVFESDSIPYTLTQAIEYAGEVYEATCYWTLGEAEEIEKGFYNIDFFCDGNLIGSFPVQLKK